MTLLAFLATLALTVLLFVLIPKGFLPTQDTGLITGLSEAAQNVSPDKMRSLDLELTPVIERDPDVATVGSVFGSSSGNTSNTGRFFIGLKPHDQRNASALQIVNRLRPQLAKGLYQDTLKDANTDELNIWAERLLGKLRTLPELADSDQQSNAPQIMVTINREAAARFGIQPELVNSELNDAFGQRQVAQYYTQVNSYSVILEVLQEFRRDHKAVEKPSTSKHHPLDSRCSCLP
jgi:multidrug efflux pump subunit AcrB